MAGRIYTVDEVRTAATREWRENWEKNKVLITDSQTLAARKYRRAGKSWEWIAESLGVPLNDLIVRCDRPLARKMGLRAPGWLYDW